MADTAVLWLAGLNCNRTLGIWKCNNNVILLTLLDFCIGITGSTLLVTGSTFFITGSTLVGWFVPLVLGPSVAWATLSSVE